MENTDTSTILVVDDNPAHRYATGRFLRAAGFSVKEAATGQDAILEAQDLPALIVLDVNLPDIDGFEVCRAIRRNATTARIPIVHLSATFVGSADYVHGLNAGADGYLTHPVEPAVLVATVSAFLRTRTAEERLRRSEQRFRDIFEHVMSGIAVVGNDDRFVEVNPALCRIFGAAREQLIGRSLQSFLLPALSQAEGVHHAAVAVSFGSAGSASLTLANDARVDFEWEMVHNECERIFVVIDVTSRHRLELEREYSLGRERAARAEAEKANRVKDQFLASVSHELRSPLNAIVGWAHILQLKASACPEEFRKGVDAIDRNAKLQSRLINDLLDVSRASSGKLFIEKQPVSLWSVIQSAYSDAGTAAAARQIRIDLLRTVMDVDVAGDALRLQQMVGNLLSNAVKFSRPHDTIQLELLLAEPRTAAIRVTDRGRGIASEFLPYIFDTFRQEDAAANRSHEGMGLGLAIVKRLAEVHGGSVAVDSAGLGQGASFTLLLPTIERGSPLPGGESHDVSHAAARETGDAVAGLRVLYVDDDADARDMVERLLCERQARVTLASSAAEALSLIARGAPDLIISDIGMPKQDGYSFMQQVKTVFRDSRPPPAIALTAFGQEQDRQRAVASGYVAHLTKPIDPGELFLTIARIASRDRKVVVQT